MKSFAVAIVLLGIGVVAATISSGNAEAQPRTCFGREITVDLNLGERPTTGDDVVLGTPGDDVIRGRGGDDAICSGAGDDVVYGGWGNDLIRTGRGDDELFGGAGRDRLLGGPGDDALHGGRGRGITRGGRGVDDCAGVKSRSRGCEPNCLDLGDLAVTVGSDYWTLLLTNSGSRECHFGTGISVSIAGFTKQAPQVIDEAQRNGSSPPTQPTALGSGQTLGVKLFNRPFLCPAVLAPVKAVSVRGGLADREIELDVLRCGLAFELTVIDSDSPSMGLRSVGLSGAAKLEVVGTACPTNPEWGGSHHVYLAVDLGAAASTPRVVEPDPDGGHLSFTLVPEVTGGVLIEPDSNGLWEHTWAGDLAEGEHTLSAVCVGGSGLEAGFVHYGQQRFVVLTPP